MPSQAAIEHRLTELSLRFGDEYTLSAGDSDLVHRALERYAQHCADVTLELSLLPGDTDGGFYRRQRERCHALRDIFEMAVEIRAVEVGAA